MKLFNLTTGYLRAWENSITGHSWQENTLFLNTKSIAPISYVQQPNHPVGAVSLVDHSSNIGHVVSLCMEYFLLRSLVYIKIFYYLKLERVFITQNSRHPWECNMRRNWVRALHHFRKRYRRWWSLLNLGVLPLSSLLWFKKGDKNPMNTIQSSTNE